MEENLMEKLLQDFNQVIREFDALVADPDKDRAINGVQRVLREVNRLVAEEHDIKLDDRSEEQYDHVLHELLDKLHGTVEGELAAVGIDGIKGSRFYENSEVERMSDDEIINRDSIQNDINRLIAERDDTTNPPTDDRRNEIERELEDSNEKLRISNEKIQTLENSIIPGETYSSLTYVDPDLALLHEEREVLVEEKKAIEEENEKIEHDGLNPEHSYVDPAIVSARVAALTTTKTPEQSGQDLLNNGITPLLASLREIDGHNNNGYIDGVVETPGATTASTKRVETVNPAFITKISDLVNEATTIETELTSAPGTVDLSKVETLLSNFDSAIEEYENHFQTNLESLPDTDLKKQFYQKQIEVLKNAKEAIKDRVDEYNKEAEDRAIDPAVAAVVAGELSALNDVTVQYNGTTTNYKDIRDIERRTKRLELERARLEADKLNTTDSTELDRINKRLGEITAILKEFGDIKDQATTITFTSLSDKNAIKSANENRITDIETRINDIDQDIRNNFPGATRNTKINVEEKAKEIGEHIFKTAQIRRELAEREVSREEFLAFYQAGIEKTREQQRQLISDYENLNNECGNLHVDPDSEETLLDQLNAAQESGDADRIKEVYEKIRRRFIEIGREDNLATMGLDHELTTPEDVDNMKQFYENYMQYYQTAKTAMQNSSNELRENLAIFSREINRIKQEEKSIELAGGETPDEIQAKANERKDLRKKLLEATMVPMGEELTDEQKELLDSWQEASDRFLSKVTTKPFRYIDSDGVEKEIEIDTIDVSDYPEYEKDIEFLGIPAYKENLEMVSAYRESGDPRVFGSRVYEAYQRAEENEEGSGNRIIEAVMADKQKYIETFNGVPNPHKVKYENWKTAGSTLKGMKPVSRDLPMPTRAKNAVENAFRFLGIRVPKFTKLNEKGEEVKDIAGGVGTLVTDGLVIGAVGVTAATLGPAVAVAGYAAKGLVTLGNKIRARVEYSKHKDEIDGNLPVLRQSDKDSREVARKEYYREQGNNRFVSWAKAKADRYFTKNRARETEGKIVEKLSQEYAETEDARTTAIIQNVEIAKQNQEARLKRQKQVAMGANTYNDIVRDSGTMFKEDGSLDEDRMNEATAAIARNAALESVRPGRGKEDVNATSTVDRMARYVKDDEEIEQTAGLNQDAFKVVGGPVSAITAEQIYTGRKQKVDRVNKVLTLITTGALKFGYTAFKDGFIRTDTIHHDAQTQDTIVHHDAQYDEVEVPIYEEQLDTSKTLEEITQMNSGKDISRYYSVSGGKRGEEIITLQGDEKITAAWVDNGSKWGTGISDKSGLTAPTLTDRVADASLIGPNGVLRQDATLQEVLDNLGCTAEDLVNGKVAFSLDEQGWGFGDKLVESLTKQVQVGTEIQTQLVKDAWDETVTTVIKDAWDETITTYAPELARKALIDGLAVGAGIGVADQMHEAFQTTYIAGMTPGRPEEVTPQAQDSIRDIVIKLQEEANRRRERPEPEHEGDERE